MQVAISVQNDHFALTSTCPTVVSPGKEVAIELQFQARAAVEITNLHWVHPEVLELSTANIPQPLILQAGENRSFTQVFTTQENREGFGEIKGSVGYRPLQSAPEEVQTWKNWISVFGIANADAKHPLNDELRRRLISVVNARCQNGHILMADFGAFFREYLHIHVPEQLALAIGAELGLPVEGLPLDAEMFHLFASGQRSFYGLECLELVAEEDCVESDDRFDKPLLREQEHLPVEL